MGEFNWNPKDFIIFDIEEVQEWSHANALKVHNILYNITHCLYEYDSDNLLYTFYIVKLIDYTNATALSLSNDELNNIHPRRVRFIYGLFFPASTIRQVFCLIL